MLLNPINFLLIPYYAKEHSASEFRRQIRESDDALAAAVSGNEHLRDQMEEQRRRFQEKNEASPPRVE